MQVLHLVQVLAEKLVLLQQAGNVKYIGFKMRFGCACIKPTDLEDYIERMQSDLDNWLYHVEKCRKQYYHLNYFTAKQLVLLRKELGSLKANPESSANPQLYCLLQSVCAVPTLEIIRHALQVSETERSLALKAKNTKESRYPALKYESLSDKQKKIYSELKKHDFHDNLILDALGEVEEDEEAAHEWCAIHEADYQSMDTNTSQPIVMTVDESHPQVQDLMREFDYSFDVAIEAVQKAGEDYESAKDIAALLVPGGGGNHDSLVDSYLAATRESQWYFLHNLYILSLCSVYYE